jgi:methylated-DNA-[protein]-cysteine S-methyltransferase
MSLLQHLYESKIGSLYLVATEKGLKSLFWDPQPIPMVDLTKDSSAPAQILSQTVLQLDQYFAGERNTFDLAMDLDGTAFQKQVWKELLKIPFGKTVSYSDIAKNINNEKAVRAVGSANGKNPLCIIIPCHRVIASDGTLGGYSGGLENKKALLSFEKSKETAYEVQHLT